jgi:hypothetical protein
MAFSDENDPELRNKIRAMISPSHIEQSVRQAIRTYWIVMPDENRTIDELEKQFRRIVDRAFEDLREDGEAFGLLK